MSIRKNFHAYAKQVIDKTENLNNLHKKELDQVYRTVHNSWARKAKIKEVKEKQSKLSAKLMHNIRQQYSINKYNFKFDRIAAQTMFDRHPSYVWHSDQSIMNALSDMLYTDMLLILGETHFQNNATTGQSYELYHAYKETLRNS